MTEKRLFLARHGEDKYSKYVLATTHLRNIAEREYPTTWGTDETTHSLPVEVCADVLEVIAESPDGERYTLPPGAQPREVRLRLIVEEVG